jgi:prevent-host-death family protein
MTEASMTLVWPFEFGYYELMRTVSVSEAKNTLSALLQDVRGGAAIVITDRGVPVAQLGPLPMPAGLHPGVIALAQQGRLVLPASPPTTTWLDLPSAEPTPGASAVAMLLAERGESP